MGEGQGGRRLCQNRVRKNELPKESWRFPDFERSKAAVLNSLTSQSGQRIMIVPSPTSSTGAARNPLSHSTVPPSCATGFILSVFSFQISNGLRDFTQAVTLVDRFESMYLVEVAPEAGLQKVVINRELYGEGFRQEILGTKHPELGLSPSEHSLAKRKCPALPLFNSGAVSAAPYRPTICNRDISPSAVARSAVDGKHQGNSCR